MMKMAHLNLQDLKSFPQSLEEGGGRGQRDEFKCVIKEKCTSHSAETVRMENLKKKKSEMAACEFYRPKCSFGAKT